MYLKNKGRKDKNSYVRSNDKRAMIKSSVAFDLPERLLLLS